MQVTGRYLEVMQSGMGWGNQCPTPLSFKFFTIGIYEFFGHTLFLIGKIEIFMSEGRYY